MKLFTKWINFSLPQILLVLLSFLCNYVTDGAERLVYPSVRRDDNVIDVYHQTSVKDPYRWLEQDSAETRKFIADQNKLTQSYLDSIDEHERIRDKLKEIWNFPKYMDAPVKAGNRYYYSENSGLQNQGVIYVQKSLAEDEEPEVFFDPNKEFADDETLSLRDYFFSRDGTIFSYCFSKSGTDWKTCYFKNVTSGLYFRDKIEGLKFSSLQWTHDNLGFFYTSYPMDGPTRRLDNEKGHYHIMGTKQEEDTLILEFPQEPQRNIGFEVSDDGKYLLAFPNSDFKANGVYLTSLERGVYRYMIWIPVFSTVNEASYTYVTNEGSVFYFKTDRNATRSQIIQVETDRLKNPRLQFTTLIPEHPKNVLDFVRAVANNKLLMIYIEDMKHKLEIRNLNDGELFVNIDVDVGAVVAINNKVRAQNELCFLFESFVFPARIYHCAFTDENATCSIFKESKIPNLDVSNIVTQQVFYPSRDGTQIPMFLVHKEDLDRNETHPVFLTGYGGFNSNNQPNFEIQNLIFIKYFNGIYATPGLRGGGEYGEKWHAQGSLLNKRNVFYDFQAGAEYLIREKYTQPSKLIISGVSNGGLLVGVSINLRPDLYGTAIAKVGVMDMIRYHKLGVGFWWIGEYGSSDTKEHFRNLMSYSPLHNIQKYMLETIQYPAVLVLTGEQDDRVLPAHSYKYAAELQYRIGNLPQQTNPLLLQVSNNSGHGLARTPSDEIKEWADIFAFISKTIDLEFSYASGHQIYAHLGIILPSVFISIYCTIQFSICMSDI